MTSIFPPFLHYDNPFNKQVKHGLRIKSQMSCTMNENWMLTYNCLFAGILSDMIMIFLMLCIGTSTFCLICIPFYLHEKLGYLDTFQVQAQSFCYALKSKVVSSCHFTYVQGLHVTKKFLLYIHRAHRSTVECWKLRTYCIIMLLYLILHNNIITYNVNIYPIVSSQRSLESICSIWLLIKYNAFVCNLVYLVFFKYK